MNTAYQLRKAAGSYWLLDMEQPGLLYKPPVPLNESGADIWRLLADEGKGPEQIAEIFAQEYGMAVQDALLDIRQFMQQLRKQGIKC